MKEIVLDTFIDALKLLPFLFLVFFFLEYFEHKLAEKSKKMILKAGRFGPFIGGVLGVIPQCGFGVAATNLYAMRIITLGTLFSIYLSTSDEMLPILLSHNVSLSFILYVLCIKVVVGIVMGFGIDLVLRKKKKAPVEIKDFCEEEHCHCNHEHSLIKSAVRHTANILLFITLVQLVLNTAIWYLGEEQISRLFMSNNAFASFLVSLLGLIPNCAASVIITELFISGTIQFGSLLGGLLTGSGIALLVLFRVNKNVKENVGIIITLYLIGSILGFLVNILGIL